MSTDGLLLFIGCCTAIPVASFCCQLVHRFSTVCNSLLNLVEVRSVYNGLLLKARSSPTCEFCDTFKCRLQTRIFTLSIYHTLPLLSTYRHSSCQYLRTNLIADTVCLTDVFIIIIIIIIIIIVIGIIFRPSVDMILRGY